jgi:hypothetical protein
MRKIPNLERVERAGREDPEVAAEIVRRLTLDGGGV